MKISVCSDLHLEVRELVLENVDNATVLVLAGDICVANSLGDRAILTDNWFNNKSQTYHRFFQDCCKKWERVIFIMGNHEHYHGDYADTLHTLRTRLGYLDNLHILEEDSVRVEDVTFLCGTLWTDMNSGSQTSMRVVQGIMNDFRCVSNSLVPHISGRPRRFTPQDACEVHKDTLEYIRLMTYDREATKFVVVSHHAPSRQSTHPRFAHERDMNGAFSSDLDWFIEDHPQIKLWIHGHTHDPWDYKVGSTRVVCNPRGYAGYESTANGYVPKTVEV
jgi:Icc-related predicted phosphoesterase